jgi:8-amino-3,8-dideoxy-alpha-D-manno-octulosonate transaminase
MADLGALKTLCGQYSLLLLEDACQAIGGSYDQTPLGAYGDIGCFSFDYVKTITAGEGGAVITNNETYYRNADHYSDHGHDHNGKDRGAEGHPFLGYNFRISELHAAVGLAQLARLDEFIAIQKRNYSILRDGLTTIRDIQFRRVPETGVENYSFLSFYLPTAQLAVKASEALKKERIDGCFYWFNNNWHYHKRWDHLKQLISLGPMPQEIRSGLQDRQTDFSQSDQWVGRNISCLIKLGWSEQETASRVQKMVSVLRSLI